MKCSKWQLSNRPGVACPRESYPRNPETCDILSSQIFQLVGSTKTKSVSVNKKKKKPFFLGSQKKLSFTVTALLDPARTGTDTLQQWRLFTLALTFTIASLSSPIWRYHQLVSVQSPSGTFVNNVRVKQHVLEMGDMIRIGDFHVLLWSRFPSLTDQTAFV